MKARCIDHRLPVARPLLIYKSDSGENKLSTSPPFHRVSERQGSKEAVGSVAKTVSVSQNKTSRNGTEQIFLHPPATSFRVMLAEKAEGHREREREKQHQQLQLERVVYGSFCVACPVLALAPRKRVLFRHRNVRRRIYKYVWVCGCTPHSAPLRPGIGWKLCGVSCAGVNGACILLLLLCCCDPPPPFTRGCYPLGGLVGGFVCVCNRVKGRVREASAGFC